MVIPSNSDGDSSNKTKVTQVSDLDFGNPLYLHASDTSTTSLVNFKLKGTENYNIWSCAMILALETKNKIGFIDGSCERDLEDEVLGRQWDRCNSVVLSWILGSVTEEVYLGQIFSKCAATVWQELKETYDKVDGSITFNLHQKINSLTQNGSSISEYYHKLNSLWKQFDALVKLPTCTCNASKVFCDHNQLIKLMQFLMGLDDTYSSIRSNILTRDPLPNVKTAFSIISREESHRGSSSSSKNKTQSSAFAAKTFENKKSFGPYRGPNSNLKCTKCNKTGHTIERCYEIVGFPPGYAKKNNNQPSQKNFSGNNFVTEQANPNANFLPFSNDQISKLMKLIGEQSSSGNVNANMAGFESHDQPGDW